MAHPQTPRLHSSRLLPRYTAIMAVVLCLASACPAQAGPAGQPGVPWPDVKKYPGLLPEFARLLEKMQHNLKFPAARGQSRLLPLLPASTIVYAAFPNYGDVTYQALKIFQRELKESEVLRNWWQRGEPAKIGPQVEDALEKVYEVSQYLGEEVVISGAPESKEPSLLIMAEVRKPGLKPVLQQVIKVLAGKGKPPLRVLEPGELATVDDRTSSQQLLVLVRPDYVVAASSAAALRSLNEKLERNNREFIATSFEQRIAQAYEGGAGILAAADLQKILDQMPPAARDDKVFQRTGFSDLKYIVWEHKDVPGQPSSQMELSFTGLRRGMASWLAAPRPLGGLDFVSPGAVIAASVVLRNPAQIFDDVREIATATNPNGSRRFHERRRH